MSEIKKIRENLARNYRIKTLIVALESAWNSPSNSIHIVEANITYKNHRFYKKIKIKFYVMVCFFIPVSRKILFYVI